MADEVGSGQVAIVPTFVGFRSKVTTEVDTAGAESGRKFSSAFGASVRGIGSFVGKSLMAGGAIAGAIGAISIKGGISKALQIEDATAKMTGLGNSTDTVKTVMSNALSAVKGTAFGMGDAANIASTALASGIKPGAEMSKYLTLVADAASIAQVPLGEMGQIMGKVTNSGKVTNDVLNQFGDRGVGVLQMLAKHYGVTADQMTEMVSKGKVDAATFNQVLTENVGGAAKKSGDTTKGAFANMKSAMANFGMAATGGLFPLVKRVFGQIQLIFEGLTKRIKPFADAWSAQFSGRAGPVIDGFATKVLAAVDRMGPAFTTLIGGIRAFGAAWAANDGDVTSSGFAGFMERTANVLRALQGAIGQLNFSSVKGFFDSLGPAVGSAGPAFSSIGSSLSTLQPAFAAFGQQLPKISEGFAKLAGVALNALVTGLGFLADHVDTIIAWMPAIVAGFVAWRIATSAMSSAMFGLQAAQVAMAPVNLANNILRVTAIRLEQQHAAATGANTVAQNTSRLAAVRNGVALAASKAAQLAGAAATGIATAAQWAWNAAMTANPIGLIILAIVALVAGLVWFFTQTELGRQIFAAAFAFIQAAAQAVADWFMNTFLPWIASVWAGIQAGLGVLGTFFSDLWNGIVAFLTQTWTNIVGAVGAFIGFVLGLFFTFNPLGIIIANFGAIVGFLAGIWASIIGGIGGFIGGAVGFFTGLPGQILAALGNLGTLLLDSGKALIQGFIDGIKGMVSGIGDAVGGVLDFAKSFFPHSPAKRGPFSGKGYTSHSGTALATDFAKSIAAEQGTVASAASRLMTAATLTGNVNAMGTAGGTAGGGDGWQGSGAQVNVTMPVTERVHPADLARALDNRLNYKMRRASA